MSKNITLLTAGGHIRCTQCLAKAKSTKQQCRRPACKGRRVCKLHGGKSTGPRTQEGRQRCAQARLVHGRETSAARMERSLGSARLAVLEEVGFAIGLLTGTRTRGPKPHRLDQAYPELQELLRARAKRLRGEHGGKSG